MPDLSTRGKNVPSSPIRKLAPYADQAKERGIHVYHLNIGQPDIHTPHTFMQPIRNVKMDVLAYGPSAGFTSLRKKLVKYYTRYQIDLEYDQILVTTGGSEAIVFALMAICDSGDEVIIPEPFYTNFNGFASEAGVKIVPITSSIEEDFRLPPITSIADKIGKKTKAILICNPNNPTGYVYSNEEMEALRELVLQHDLFLLSDEVYREFIYEDTAHISVLQLKGLEEHAIMLDSVSKRYSACGARIGMIASRNRDVIDACLRFGMARLCPPTLEQIGTEQAIDTPPSYFDEVLQEYKRRRDTMVAALRQIPGVLAPMPRGAFYLVVRLPIDDAENFSRWLLTDFERDGETVMLAPASGFYSTPGLGRDEVRIAYVLNQEDIRKAMHILAEGLKVYPGRKI